MSLKDIAEIYKDSLNPGKRWEQGAEHHLKSIEIMKHIEALDFHYNSDYFCFKVGGDGDNGESLMYLFDMFFEMKDELNEHSRKQNSQGRDS